jgi:cell wall arabinan synthesis protein/EmbC-like arabinotransferase in arabinogalactan biosynthesis/arabinosyltransferase-like concanavalin domain-containing protein
VIIGGAARCDPGSADTIAAVTDVSDAVRKGVEEDLERDDVERGGGTGETRPAEETRQAEETRDTEDGEETPEADEADNADEAREAEEAEEPARPGPPEPTGSSVRGAPPRRRGPALLAALAALVALVCGALLPFAPVAVNEPTLTWPRDPARPESTLLQLAAYRPLAMDIRFSCEAVALAQSRGGVVLSTAAPDSPVAGTIGLIATARDGRLLVGGLDKLLLDEAVGPGPCEYRITGRSAGLPSFQDVEMPAIAADPGAPKPSGLAGPDNARLEISRDGRVLFGEDTDQLPDVDVLATSLTSVPAGGLSVTLRLDDEFSSTATPLKRLLIGGLLGGLLVAGALLVLLDRRTPRVPTVWRPAWPRVVDVVVPAVLVLWTVIAPATDDDGYYAAMARNSALTGDVGNYYQLYDQSFTPFTWFYAALGQWQQLVGDAPVPQRIPALVFGVLTYFALRRVVVLAMREWAPDSRWTRVLAHALLGVTYLAWWVPLDMGVRPETVVAMTGAFTLLAVLSAARRKRLGLAWLAFLLAGIGFTAHPTGFTLFAPLLAGLPLLWPLVRVRGDRLGTALRFLAVASGGLIALFTAFADGALRDFLRGQSIFLSIQRQDDWTSEVWRYYFLLTDNPMGNFAKRSAVLVCIVALVWFAVLAVAARMRRVELPTALWFSGATTGLAFAALWLTPSKWSHHFGSLAGVGPLFLALLLTTAVPLTRRVLDGARPPVGVLAAVAGSFLVAIALAWHGPNKWAYAWLDGMHRPEHPPAVSGVELDSPLLWLLVFAVVAVALAFLPRRPAPDFRLGALRAVPVVVVLSLIGSAGYLVGTFALAAAEGVPRDSIWAQSWADPTGGNCGAAGAVRVYDPTTAVPLAAASPAPAPTTAQSPTTTAAATAPDDGTAAPTATTEPAAPTAVTAQDPAYAEYFLSGDGYYAGNRPQGTGAAQIWGSLLGRDGLALERNVGRMSTGWYQLPAGTGTGGTGTAVTVLAAGTLEDGNTLTAVYARSGGGVVTPFEGEDDDQLLTDTAHDPSWRTFVLEPPAGADLVRLDAVDATGGVHGWLGFTAPALSRAEVLADHVPAGAPVALGWPQAFNYPCLRQPHMVNGVTEAPQYAVLYGSSALGGFGDGVWRPSRGGAFAQVPRTQSVQQLAVAPGVDPNIQVYAFDTPLARAAYALTHAPRTTPGASISVGG